MHVLYHLPVVDVCSSLYGIHETGDAMHVRTEHATGMLHSLFLHLVPRLHIQATQRHHEDRHSHQQDAKAELYRKRLADMSDYAMHLYVLLLFSPNR